MGARKMSPKEKRAFVARMKRARAKKGQAQGDAARTPKRRAAPKKRTYKRKAAAPKRRHAPAKGAATVLRERALKRRIPR